MACSSLRENQGLPLYSFFSLNPPLIDLKPSTRARCVMISHPNLPTSCKGTSRAIFQTEVCGVNLNYDHLPLIKICHVCISLLCIAAQSDAVSDDSVVERGAKERRLDEAREFELLKVNLFEIIFLKDSKILSWVHSIRLSTGWTIKVISRNKASLVCRKLFVPDDSRFPITTKNKESWLRPSPEVLTVENRV